MVNKILNILKSFNLCSKFGHIKVTIKSLNQVNAQPPKNYHSCCLSNVYAEITQKTMKLPIRHETQNYYKSQSDITIEKYVVFNDYVYDTKDLSWFHPGGEKIIQLVNKREIDRFMYGSYALEIFSNSKKWAHTQDSLNLVGPPVARLIRNPPIKGLIPHYKCQVLFCTPISPSGKTYLLNLFPKKIEHCLNLTFTGFESENQFGQYFSLTIGNQKGRKRCTRLYTTIWCMRRQNISFHQNNFSNFPPFANFSHQKASQYEMNVLTSDRNKLSEDGDELIPLIIKRYEKGELTSRFLNKQRFEGEVVMSFPMGAGLKYDKVPESGLILIVCGGTGLLPFCDLIDILFKRIRYLDSPKLSDTLKKRDPLVQKDIIKQREFIVYCAVENPHELPILTLYQLNELSGSSKIKFGTTMRITQDQDIIKRDFKNIKLQKDYFDSAVEAHADKKTLGQLYICGPPTMNETMGKLMIKKNVDQKIYHFV